MTSSKSYIILQKKISFDVVVCETATDRTVLFEIVEGRKNLFCEIYVAATPKTRKWTIFRRYSYKSSFCINMPSAVKLPFKAHISLQRLTLRGIFAQFRALDSASRDTVLHRWRGAIHGSSHRWLQRSIMRTMVRKTQSLDTVSEYCFQNFIA